MIEYLGLISLFVGLAARVIVPWLAKRQQDPENAQWSMRFVWPMLVSFVLLVLLLPLLVADLEAVIGIPAQAGWLIGWGAADVGRKTYKALAKEQD